ncbi:MAG: hypothetical protein V1682_01470 [Candidatus Omnitrophota bacterium]
MTTLARMTRTVIVLTLAMDFFIFGTLAETIATYSGRYAADLEQKQALLESIKEDVCKAENDLQKNIGRIDALDGKDTGRLRAEDIDISQIMPHTEKVNVALVCMSGMLSPQHRKYGALNGADSPQCVNPAGENE